MFFKPKKNLPITEWLNGFKSPLMAINWTEDWLINQGDNQFTLCIPYASKTLQQQLHTWIEKNPHPTISLTVKQDIQAMKAINGKSHAGIKNIILVSSGKGGVGKSTTAVNLALALSQENAKVGILDADIYGPSIPHLLGTKEQFPESPDNKQMHPIEVHGIYSHSMGYLVPEEDAAIWRGPMASKALQQILNETIWPDLDYLIVDLPPGTGDIQLTIAQQFPVTASIIVTTPQDLALIDAKKGIAMFKKVDIPVLGIVENMSIHICEKCGHSSHIFGEKGAHKLTDTDVPVLAELPLDIAIRRGADDANSIVLAEPDSPVSLKYRNLAQTLALAIYQQLTPVPCTISVTQVD